MDEKKLIDEFNYSRIKAERYKIRELKRNRDFDNYLKNISEISLKLSKIRVKKNKFGNLSDEDSEKERELTKKLDFLLNEKSKYEKFYGNYRCPICQDKGRVDGKICKCLENLIKVNRFDFLNRFLPLRDFTFENFSVNYYSDSLNDDKMSDRKYMGRILKFCLEYARKFTISSPSLLLIGRTGLGKTHISASIANLVLSKNFDVFYFSVLNLLQIFEERKFSSVREFSYSEENIFKCDLLIIDDLGAEFLTKFTESVIYDIINFRTMRKLPTIINTNLGFEELGSRYDERIVSRIIGNFKPIKFVGHDIRQKKANQR